MKPIITEQEYEQAFAEMLDLRGFELDEAERRRLGDLIRIVNAYMARAYDDAANSSF